MARQNVGMDAAVATSGIVTAMVGIPLLWAFVRKAFAAGDARRAAEAAKAREEAITRHVLQHPDGARACSEMGRAKMRVAEQQRERYRLQTAKPSPELSERILRKPSELQRAEWEQEEAEQEWKRTRARLKDVAPPRGGYR